ncbi:aspartokinase 3-like [Vulpes lagopus]|uniref:aspartokinase 3-like n=1 Tax=Vulpes lagopus TaxID=494514 RepID=UPI001BC9655C|nr:aspartokinase 3-like [Vulpes lagopus]
MKVIKFGGSSLASAEQLKKVLDIVTSDPERRFVIVSAPGKRHSEDTKVTDALIKYYKNYVAGNDVTASQKWIIDRYQAIAEELGLSPAIMTKISTAIKQLATLPIEDNAFLYDTFLAAGEDNNAKLVAEYFRKNGLSSRYMHPKEAGIIVSSEPSNARILPSSYDKLEALQELDEVIVIPGFFGVTVDGNVCTFSRGGSDISGSIVAAGVKADLYENFTDVDGIFAAHPGVVHKPHTIKELTYREMRELAYAGFSVLHDEALIPAYRADDNFASINMSKYLMNREVGFGRKVLQILEELNIRWEHMPTGIDDMSIIVRERELTPIKEQEITTYLTRELGVDEVDIEHGLSIIMIVGEDMKNHIGVTATATKALSEKHINLEMISQGSSEVSVMFVTQTEHEKQAVRALYKAFFQPEED